MVTSTTVIGRTTRLTALDNTHIPMEPSTRASGSMTNNMEKERKRGLTELIIRANINLAKKMATENFSGLINPHMQDSS